MKVLVVGGGGREHALVWKLAQSPKVEKIYCAPGNAGIAGLAENLPISAEDVDALVAKAVELAVDLVVVGPEAPLTMGLTDQLVAKGIRVFGANAKAAQIEGSKAFAKHLMKKYGIPTGDYEVFKDYQTARSYLEEKGGPIVLKADGLAAGKGVFVCQSTEEALDALDRIMKNRDFGAAGETLVVEELLTGEEASFLVFTDGRTIISMPSSQDHKAVLEGDRGPNTGGMGAYSPAPVITPELEKEIIETVMRPTIDGLASEGCPYKGVLYAGLMIGEKGPQVLEFNARFGDPEAQPLLMRLKTDLLDIIEAVVEGRLNEIKLKWSKKTSVCVVLAAEGYPGAYEKGRVINGLDQAAQRKKVMVFHAGTAEKDGQIVTSGGRVLGVCALGDDVETAIERAYRAVDDISWDGMYCRRDIGRKALDRSKGFTMHDPSAVPAVRGESSLKAWRAPLVGIIMGSDSDAEAMKGASDTLEKFGVSYEMTVASAHRTPDLAGEFAASAKSRGMKVLIAGAGWAAHLAGALAAQTTLPVIGVPLDSSPLSGWDALLSTAQMPPGVPVATMSIGKGGAVNAALLAIQMLALSDDALVDKLEDHKAEMAEGVRKKAQKIQKRFMG